jgi:prepilin-type N-terminal cleavage/methylation domain-containing protein
MLTVARGPLPVPRPAFTLFEVLVACTMIGIAAGIAAPRIRATMDWFAVEGASREVVNGFALARLAALRHRGADVQLDSLGFTVRAAGRIIHQRAVPAGHGVRMRVNTALVRYAATGLAFGLSNGTIILSRGVSADTVVISRLGRVRR